MAKNIFVAGLDKRHLKQLQALRDAGDYRFHSLISYKKIKCGPRFPVRDFLQDAERTLSEFNGSVDAIVGFWDFPVSTVLPVLRERFNLEGPCLQSVLKCEHKYWSRLLQALVVPDMVPPFSLVDPFNKDAPRCTELPYPFWLKPVKSVLSHLGFLVRNPEDFQAALKTIRRQIGRYAEPFNFILELANLPAEIRAIDGYHCIAEGLISRGRQCTLEGYVHGGEVCLYAAIDSIRERRYRSSFSRYQYPSMLPSHIRRRMADATAKVLTSLGYDNAPFNIEFYWEKTTDAIYLLEINPRISKSHCPLFKMVDGEYHHKVMIDLALGRKPNFPHRQGPFRTAAKFMLRRHSDGIVAEVPGRQAIKSLQSQFPGTEVHIDVKKGTRLSSLRDQDSYSYQIGELFMGASSHRNLMRNYRRAVSMLPFTFNHPELSA